MKKLTPAYHLHGMTDVSCLFFKETYMEFQKATYNPAIPDGVYEGTMGGNQAIIFIPKSEERPSGHALVKTVDYVKGFDIPVKITFKNNHPLLLCFEKR